MGQGARRLPSAPKRRPREAETRANVGGEHAASCPRGSLGKHPGLCEPERPELPGRAFGKMLFPNGASQRGFDECSPRHPSTLRRTDDFTVVTDKGSHLPIPKPKKENGGWGGEAVSGGRIEKTSLEITAMPRNSTVRAVPWALSSGT